jgi:flagellar biosynthesis/type III secretory pathway protein FliH
MGLATASGTEHRYQLCRDEDCERTLCRIYREGYRNGREDGFRDGYDEGFPEGIMACPRSHGGG